MSGTSRLHSRRPTVSVGRRFAGKLGGILRQSHGRPKPAHCFLGGSGASLRWCRCVGTGRCAASATQDDPDGEMHLPERLDCNE